MAARPQPLSRQRLRIRPTRGWASLNLGELWSYRDLLLILAGRDVKLRYRQTALGVAWVVLQPLLAAAIFAVIFGLFARLPSDGLPYGLFVLCGLLPWNLISGAAQRAGNSLVAESRLIAKIYFPRLLLPLASTAAVLIDLLVSLGVLAAAMALYAVAPGWRVLTLPLFMLLGLLLGAGASFWISALNVRYRDAMYALPFLVQVWLYASPVVYSAGLVPERWRLLYSLNPAVGVIEGFRWALLGSDTLSAPMLLASVAVALALFVGGAFFFRRVERGFADVI
jgi:lipopolysaccharide transport system permease protein